MSEHEVAGFKGFSPILQRRSGKIGKGVGGKEEKVGGSRLQHANIVTYIILQFMRIIQV